MKLNKLLALLLVVCVALACTACSDVTAPTTTVAPTATAVPTEAATEAPTEAPTEAVTEAPTEEPAEETAAVAAAAEEEEDEDADEDSSEEEDFVMAYVNGEAVLYSTVAGYAEYIYDENGYDDDESEDTLRNVYQQALEAAMGYTIMGQKAEAMGLKILTDEEEASVKESASAEWSEYVDYYASMFGYTEDGDEETNQSARLSAISFLESYGYTEDAILQDARDNAWYEKLTAEICKDVTVTDDDVTAAFESAVAEDKEYFEGNPMYYEFVEAYYGYTPYYVPAGFRGVKQILLAVDEDLLSTYQTLKESYTSAQEAADAESEEEAEGTEDGATSTDSEATTTDLPATLEQVQAAEAAVLASVQSTVDEIDAKLAEGVSFDELVMLYNTDTGMQEEPYKSQGYSVAADSIIYDQAFIDAAFSVDTIGQVSKPYVGEYGVYIVQYYRDVPEGAIEFTDSVRSEIYESVVSEKESAKVNEVVEGWLDEADVIIDVRAYDYLPYPDAATATDVTETTAAE